jgi:hypothetical protein
MSLWGVTGVAPFLVAALLGGGHATVAGHGISRDAGQATLIRVSARLAASDQHVGSAVTPPLSVPGSAPVAVLRQTESGQWQTTVLLSDIAPGCSDASKADYLLATTSPDGVTPGVPSPMPHITPRPGSGISLNGSSCEVQVTFPGPGQVPQTAALVIDQPGASATIVLTVSRNVTLFSYIVIPLAVGLIIAALYFFLALRITTYDDAGAPQGPRDLYWWEHPILGSGAWTINDSWTTNISTGLVVVSAVLTTTAAASSLFPGVALDRFTLVNLVAGAIVTAAPVIFGICYARFTARNPGLTADAILKLPPDRTVAIRLPSGASITMSADTTIQDSSGDSLTVRAGSAYQIPAGSEIVVRAGAKAVMQAVTLAAAPLIARVLAEATEQTADDAATRRMGPVLLRLMEQALLRPEIQDALTGGVPVEVHIIDRMVANAGIRSARQSVTQAIISAIQQVAMDTYSFEAVTFPGTSDIGVLPASTLLIDAPSGTWTIQKSDMMKSAPWDTLRDVAVTYPALIAAGGGAKITVTGAADMTFPKGAVISAPRRADYTLPKARKLLAPLGSEVIVANMRIMLIANCVTMLGLGAELGIGGVLAYFSEAIIAWRIVIMCAVAVVGVLVLAYAKSATRAMADPQPGSSISAQAGTSFTL